MKFGRREIPDDLVKFIGIIELFKWLYGVDEKYFDVHLRLLKNKSFRKHYLEVSKYDSETLEYFVQGLKRRKKLRKQLEQQNKKRRENGKKQGKQGKKS